MKSQESKKNWIMNWKLRIWCQVFWSGHFSKNKEGNYILKVDYLKFEIEDDFSDEDFVGLRVGGVSGDDVLFGQCEDDVLLWIHAFGEEAFDDGMFFEDLDREWGRDGREGWVLDVLDVHV